MLELAERRPRPMDSLRPLASRFPEVDGLRWHLRTGGQGPVLLLLHGTGSASGSWRGLLPALAQRYCVLAPDLPGHGDTGDPGATGLGLVGMGSALRRLLDHLALEPVLVVGHSAGAALACRMSLDGRLHVRRVVALNGALLPPLHMPLGFLSPLARLVAALPLVPELMARRARDPEAVRRLIEGTGSRLDAEGMAFYRGLLRSPRHISAALRMMAAWDLVGLARDLPRLAVPLDLLVADGDRTIPPAEALRVHSALPGSRVLHLARLGHLAHEEDPGAVLDALLPLLDTPADRTGGAAAAGLH